MGLLSQWLVGAVEAKKYVRELFLKELSIFALALKGGSHNGTPAVIRIRIQVSRLRAQLMWSTMIGWFSTEYHEWVRITAPFS